MYNGYWIITLCMGKIYDERNVDFICALNEVLCEKNFRLLIYQTCSDMYWKNLMEEGERLIFDAVDYEISDAVLIFDETFHDDERLESLYKTSVEKGVPTFCIGTEREGLQSFPFDYADGFKQVVEHVLGTHGISDVHMIAGIRGEKMSEERIRVFKELLAKHDIPYQDNMLSYGDYWEYPTRDALNVLISEKRVPRALICANDMMAMTVCEVLKQEGYAIPEDVIVTGFDGVTGAYLANPPITTCKCDFVLMSQSIANVLEDVLNGEETERVHPVKYMIDVLDSCGCGKGSKILNPGLELKAVRDMLNKYQDDERVFAGRISQVPFCENRQDFYDILQQCGYYYTAVLVNRECFDESVSPMQKVRQDTFDREMYVAYIAEKDRSQWPERATFRDLLSEEFGLLGRPCPLVFTALNYLDIPMGIVCFYFYPSMHDYYKISQYTTSIANAISTYRNIKYQQYMIRIVEESYKQDYLTGLYNRDGFYKEYGAVCKLAAKMEHPKILVASADLDGLKYINDTFGHEEGDFAIRCVARALVAAQVGDKLCARFGGDEMVLCMVGEDLDGMEEKIRQDMLAYTQEINETSNKPYPISFSLGISTREYSEGIFESVLRESDERMYEEKKTRPNRRR